MIKMDYPDSVTADLAYHDYLEQLWYDKYMRLQDEIEENFKDVRETYQRLEDEYGDLGDDEVKDSLIEFLRTKKEPQATRYFV